jgi:hypothetical protein
MKKIIDKKLYIYPLLFLIVSIASLYIIQRSNDDLWFAATINNWNQLPKWLINRYNVWSSRIIIETFLIFFSKHYVIFTFVNSLVLTLFIKFFADRFNDSKKALLLVCALVFFFPPGLFESAGVVAVCLNYLWPTAIILYVLRFVKNNSATNIWGYIAIVVATIFATNQEQTCMFTLFYLLFSSVVKLIQKDKIGKTTIIVLGISILGMINTAVCPGNKARTLAETKAHFPEFAKFGLFTKLDLGWASTLKYFFYDANVLIIIFLVLLPVLCLKLNKKNITIFAASIPVLAQSIATLGGEKDLIMRYLGKLTPLGTGFSVTNPKSYIFDITLLILFSCVVYAVAEIFSEKKIEILTILIGSFATRFALGFSPTIWVSDNRTYFIVYTCILFLIVGMLAKIFESSKV